MEIEFIVDFYTLDLSKLFLSLLGGCDLNFCGNVFVVVVLRKLTTELD